MISHICSNHVISHDQVVRGEQDLFATQWNCLFLSFDFRMIRLKNILSDFNIMAMK